MDAGLAKFIKDFISELYEQWLVGNGEQYETTTLSAADRRVLLTKWAGEAWAALCTKDEFIRK